MKTIVLILFALTAGAVAAMACPSYNCFVSAAEGCPTLNCFVSAAEGCPTYSCLAPLVVECPTAQCFVPAAVVQRCPTSNCNRGAQQKCNGRRLRTPRFFLGCHYS